MTVKSSGWTLSASDSQASAIAHPFVASVGPPSQVSAVWTAAAIRRQHAKDQHCSVWYPSDEDEARIGGAWGRTDRFSADVDLLERLIADIPRRESLSRKGGPSIVRPTFSTFFHQKGTLRRPDCREEAAHLVAVELRHDLPPRRQLEVNPRCRRLVLVAVKIPPLPSDAGSVVDTHERVDREGRVDARVVLSVSSLFSPLEDRDVRRGVARKAAGREDVRRRTRTSEKRSRGRVSRVSLRRFGTSTARNELLRTAGCQSLRKRSTAHRQSSCLSKSTS